MFSQNGFRRDVWSMMSAHLSWGSSRTWTIWDAPRQRVSRGNPARSSETNWWHVLRSTCLPQCHCKTVQENEEDALLDCQGECSSVKVELNERWENRQISYFTSQILGMVLKIILLYFFVPLTIFFFCFLFISLFFLLQYFSMQINLHAVMGNNEVIRLQLAGNATFTSLTARNTMLEAIYSVPQVTGVLSHDTIVQLFC